MNEPRNELPLLHRSSANKREWNDYQKLSKFNPIDDCERDEQNGNERRKLCALKHSIYNPRLPTWRRIDRDDNQCRLSDEHCRHVTRLSPSNFFGFLFVRQSIFLGFFFSSHINLQAPLELVAVARAHRQVATFCMKQMMTHFGQSYFLKSFRFLFYF